MLGGTFLQSGGLYVFAILIPWCLSVEWKPSKIKNASDLAPHFLKIGLGFIILFCMFPMANLLALFFSSAELSATNGSGLLPIGKLLDSHFSSAVLGTGFLFSIFSLFLGRHLISIQSKKMRPHDIFLYFTRGTLVASSLLACYLFLQHYTGFDYRGSGFKLGLSKHLAASNTYRTLGFFSHPLSLAGGSLAIFSFYWVLFCKVLSQYKQSKTNVKSTYLDSAQGAYYLLIACLHLAFIILSGGRFAILLGTSVFILSSFLIPIPKMFRFARLGFTGFALAASSFLAIHSGALDRFQELKHLWQQGQLDRIKFWQVHWQMVKDEPWFGHGYAWLKHYKRELYYNQLGFESLLNKYNAHNLYLEILSNIGILGMIGVVTGLSLIVFSFKKISSQTEHRWLFVALLIAFVANLVNGLTQNSLFDSNIIYIYLFLVWVLTWNLLLTSSKSLMQHNSPADKCL